MYAQIPSDGSQEGSLTARSRASGSATPRGGRAEPHLISHPVCGHVPVSSSTTANGRGRIDLGGQPPHKRNGRRFGAPPFPPRCSVDKLPPYHAPTRTTRAALSTGPRCLGITLISSVVGTTTKTTTETAAPRLPPCPVSTGGAKQRAQLPPKPCCFKRPSAVATQNTCKSPEDLRSCFCRGPDKVLQWQ